LWFRGTPRGKEKVVQTLHYFDLWRRKGEEPQDDWRREEERLINRKKGGQRSDLKHRTSRGWEKRDRRKGGGGAAIESVKRPANGEKRR